MNMKQRLTAVQMKLAALEKAGMLEKPARAQDVVGEAVQLMEQMIDQIVLIGESYNGLLAYINSISNDPMTINELNAAMKTAGFGMYSEGGKNG